MTWRRIIRHCVTGSVLGVSISVTACADREAPTEVSKPTESDLAKLASQERSAPMEGFLVAIAADVKLTATGELKPGRPIRITAEVTGRHPVLRSSGQLLAEGARVNGQTQTKAAAWSSAVTMGVSNRIETIAYDKPGYYPVAIDVFMDFERTNPRIPAMKGDSVLLRSAHARAWLLIDSTGGRIDYVYDETVGQNAALAGLKLRHGTVGEFVPLPPGQDGATASKKNSGNERLLVDPVMSFNLSWVPSDSGGGQARRGLEYGNFNGSCKNGGTTLLVVQRYTDTNGNFDIICPAGSTTLQGNVTLTSAIIRVLNQVTVFGTYVTTPVSIPVTIAANTLDSAYVAYNETAKIYKHYHQWVYPYAYFEFGRTRGSIDYAYQPTGTTTAFFDINAPGENIIRMFTPNVVWTGYGDFAIVHEYGHAYQWTSIDHWVKAGYSCGAVHYINVANTNSCAYIEGFADFFAVWMQRTNTAQDFYTVADIEASIYRTAGHGVLIEGTMASMFWDIVDSGSSEAWDAVTLGPNQLADIMRQCTVNSPTSALLTHSDQIMYCLEGVANSAKFGAPTSPVNYQTTGWGTYGAALSWDNGSPPTLPNSTDFRTLWRYNLYGI